MLLAVPISSLWAARCPLEGQTRTQGDTIYLHYDQRHSKKMLRMREFAPIFLRYCEANKARGIKEKSLPRPRNEGWLSLKPAWRGLQDSLDLPAFVYSVGANDREKIFLLLYVDEVQREGIDIPKEYTPIRTLMKQAENVSRREAGVPVTSTIYILERDLKGGLTRYRSHYAIVRYYAYRGHEIIPSVLVVTDPGAYECKNFFARHLWECSPPQEFKERDQNAYKRLLRYGFLDKRLVLIDRL